MRKRLLCLYLCAGAGLLVFSSAFAADPGATDASQAYVYTRRGRIHVRQDKFDAAVRDFTQAIALNPNDSYTYYQRADLWARMGDNANAIVDLGEYLRLKPNAADGWVARGNLRVLSSGDEALNDFSEALRLNPRHVGALAGQASVWEQREDYEKAIQVLTTAIEAGPESAELYHRRARIRMKLGEHDLAIEDCSAALRLDPKNTDRLLFRSIEWTLSGNIEKALDDCRAALAIDPKKLMAYYYMALAHSRAGQLDQAIEDFDAALRIDPNDTQMRFFRAYELFNQEKFDRALAAVDEVIQTGKDMPDAYSWRGYFWMLREEWNKAIADYSQALRLKPGDAALLARRATCWTELNEFENAIQDADAALRLDPKSTEAAEAREEAIAAKNGAPKPIKPSDVIAGPVQISTVAVEAPATAQQYDLEVQRPSTVTIALEDFSSQRFRPARVPVAWRLPMVRGGIVRFKLVSGTGGDGSDLYARITSEMVSPEHITILKKSTPRFVLTDADLEAARSGTDVLKLLVLSNRADEKPAADPIGAGFEVLSSSPTLSAAELLEQARSRGAVAAEIRLSLRLLPLLDSSLPSADDFVQFSLSGPRGLMLAHESSAVGKFDEEPLPVPAYHSLQRGVSLRFELTGAPLPAAKPLYGLLTVANRWPDELGAPRNTEVPIHFSMADLEAAAAGNAVTYVTYLSKSAGEQGPARITTMKSTALPPGSDVEAEAAQRGCVLAVVKLSKELPAEPGRRIRSRDNGGNTPTSSLND